MEWNFIKPRKRQSRGGLYKLNLSDYTECKIPISYVPPKYLDAFNLFFRLENAIRIFVYYVLKAGIGRDWINYQLSKDSNSQLRNLQKIRSGKPKKYSYIGEICQNPIMYVTLQELFTIMNKRIDLFSQYFKGAFTAFKNKFDELVITRNNLAHFREITERDISRVKMILEDLNPILTEFFQRFKEEHFSELNLNEHNGLFKTWQYLIKDKKHSRLFLQTNKEKSLIMLQIGIITKTTAIKKNLNLEIFSIVEYPYVIEYINVNLPKLYKKIETVLPYITYFTYSTEISPYQEREGEHKGKYASKRMSDFGIFFYSDFNQFLNHYNDLFVSLEEILSEIEEDFRLHEQENKPTLKILKKYECHISCDLTSYKAPFDLPDIQYVEDWNECCFIGDGFLDFCQFPWIKDTLAWPD